MIRFLLPAQPQQSSRRRPGSTCQKHEWLKGSRLSPGRAMIALIVLLVAPAVAGAAAVAPAALTPQDQAQLQRVAGYLNGIRTMTAHFQQQANNGGVSSGRLWVSRPGRMRFEYEHPATMALLADAGFVYQWDKELKQTAKVELRSTPAWFILRDPVSFGPDVVVTGFQQGQGTIRVTVVEAARPDLGSLTMVFTENPLSLRQWTVVDQQGRRTTVTLSDVQTGVALDPRLFQYQYLFSPPTQ
jgi:outer membrane lipoprotein-sorting protein